MSKQRRSFTEEFKQEAVKLPHQPGAGKAAIARNLGIGVNLLARWAKAEEEAFLPMRPKIKVRAHPARNMIGCGANWRSSRWSAIY